VAQDWGTALAFHLAARRPGFVRGLAFGFARAFAASLQHCSVVNLGAGQHYLQEDHPDPSVARSRDGSPGSKLSGRLPRYRQRHRCRTARGGRHDRRIHRPCGYEKRARDVATALQQQLGIVATLVPGKGGVFEVRVGDTTVARRQKGHFPDAAEIVAAVSAQRAM
jgi:selenoprotein W-related protein